ncbi:inositol monophosphatase family protein, partial [Pseudomonas aeruginosa]
MQLDMDLCSQHLKTVTQLLRENPAERNLRDAGGMISYVKEANSRACSLLKTALAEAYPDISWGYSERTGASFSNGSGSEASWIYDPIDGAYHYLMGLPLWSSSLALVVNGETRAAFVYDPVLDEMFTAVKGEQASLNGR